MSFRTWTARAAAGVAAFASCLILAGCGGDRSAGRDETNEIVWWTFGEEDGDIKAMRSAFDRLGIPGMKLKVVRYGFEELHDKLLAVFTSGGRGAPDLCDVEISQIGRFYKHDPIGFMDLTERIRNSPFYDDQIIERAAPYSYKGRLYGIDADMTLSMIYYRRDIFEQHGINPDFPTWDDFIRAGLKLKESGIYMLQIPNGANPDNYNEDFVPQLLIQQGGGYFDKDGNITVNNEIGVRTISFINDIVNKHKIAVATGADIFDAPYYAPYLKGEIAAMIMPNWMLVFFMYGNMPELAGKWGIAPLPAWTPGGRRTSTAGGGTLVITRFTKHPEIAWRLFEQNRMSREGGLLNNALMRKFPPIKSVLADPSILVPDEYLAGQSMGEFFKEYAKQIPEYYISPFWWDAHLLMASEVLYPVLVEGADPAESLDRMAARLKQMMAR